MKTLSLALLMLLHGVLASAKLTAYFSLNRFAFPDGKPYIETYLNVVGMSVTQALNASGKYQSKLEVDWIFRQGDTIVHFDKYNLLGPESDNVLAVAPDFIDQQRFSLGPGVYEMDLRIRDLNSQDPEYHYVKQVEFPAPDGKPWISDIEQAESYTPSAGVTKFTKSGYEIIPFITGFYPERTDSIRFYAEVYNTRAMNDNFLLRYYISNNSNRQVFPDKLVSRKESPSNVIVVLATLPLTDLPSGNYNLSVEIRNRNNELVCYRQTFFQRSSSSGKHIAAHDFDNLDINSTFVASINNPDTLKEFILCLAPISTGLEAQIGENQANLGDVYQMQQFFLGFWRARDTEHPQEEWLKYKAKVEEVNNAYSTLIKKGYQTDRGRVYLQYGPPNTITADDMDPEAYPYEIWHYYKLNNQSNRKFVFYAREKSTNEYDLLHSDAIGELQDPNWELKLHSRSQQFGVDMDRQQSDDIYGSKTKENFSLPK